MAQMDGNEKRAIIDLLDEWLRRYGVNPIDSREKVLVREALNFVLDNNYHPGAYSFDPERFIIWSDQELIAYIAVFFEEMRGAMDEMKGVEDRALQLRWLVQENNFPEVLRSRA